MPVNPFVEQRKQMKTMLMRVISENPHLTKTQIIAVFSMKTGVSEKTALQYWKEIADLQTARDTAQETLKAEKRLYGQEV